MKLLLRLSLCILTAITARAAVAVPKSLDVTLTYFNIRGLAEPIRLYLSSIGVHFKEQTVDRCDPDCQEGVKDWDNFKADGIESGLLPFGQVPLLELRNGALDDDSPSLTLAQSHAILRFFAKQGYGTDTTLTNTQHTFFDIVAGGVQDQRSRYSALAYDKEIDDSKLQFYLGKGENGSDNPKSLSRWLQHFENLITKGDEFFNIPEDVLTGVDPVSFVPAVVWDMLDTNLRIDGSCLAGLPHLQRLHQQFAKIPGVATYLSSTRRRARANGRNAGYDTPDSPPHFEVTYDNTGTLSITKYNRNVVKAREDL
jgi:hypothetical protein